MWFPGISALIKQLCRYSSKNSFYFLSSKIKMISKIIWLFIIFITTFCEEHISVKPPTVPVGSHYDWKDGIIILDTSNFMQIYESDTLWAVLFYSKWCSHCAGFADTFKKFAFDIKDWSPWIRLGAIDCAGDGIDGGDNGEDVCFRMPYIVSSMPDLRFFPAQLERKQNPGSDHAGIKRRFDLSTSTAPTGETIWTGADTADMRKLTLDFLGTTLSKDLAHFKPITVSTAKDLIDATSNYLALFFEERKDLTMKTAQMDIAGYSGITVRRLNINSTETADFMQSLDLTIEPCFIIYHKTNIVQHVTYPGFGKRVFIRETLRALDVVPPVYQQLDYEVSQSELRGTESFDTFKTVDRNMIYMQDIESALYYMIKKEAKAKVYIIYNICYHAYSINIGYASVRPFLYFDHTLLRLAYVDLLSNLNFLLVEQYSLFCTGQGCWCFTFISVLFELYCNWTEVQFWSK